MRILVVKTNKNARILSVYHYDHNKSKPKILTFQHLKQASFLFAHYDSYDIVIFNRTQKKINLFQKKDRRRETRI